jgi:hypothetical protein
MYQGIGIKYQNTTILNICMFYTYGMEIESDNTPNEQAQFV